MERSQPPCRLKKSINNATGGCNLIVVSKKESTMKWGGYNLFIVLKNVCERHNRKVTTLLHYPPSPTQSPNERLKHQKSEGLWWSVITVGSSCSSHCCCCHLPSVDHLLSLLGAAAAALAIVVFHCCWELSLPSSSVNKDGNSQKWVFTLVFGIVGGCGWVVVVLDGWAGNHYHQCDRSCWR